MKKIGVFGCILLIGLLLLVFLKFSNSTGEIIRIAGKNGLEIVTVRDVSSMNQIKEVVKSITYSNENLNMQSTNEEYTIWLENNKSKTRVFNISIWSTNDNMIIFNTSEGKYGYIKSPEKDILKEILSKYIKKD